MALDIRSPSQTSGPLWGFALMFDGSQNSIDPRAPDAVRISGRVIDGLGEPVAYPDALLEAWHGEQWARSRTDDDGAFSVVVNKPAAVSIPGGLTLAPHLHLAVFARGLLKHVLTRIYFPDEERANAADPVLQRVPEDRRKTLIARPTADGLQFDVILQGEDETTFFAF